MPSCWNFGNPLCTGCAIANRLHGLPESFPRVSACLTLFSFMIAVSQPLQNLSLSSSLLFFLRVLLTIDPSAYCAYIKCRFLINIHFLWKFATLTFQKQKFYVCPEQQLFWTKLRHRKSKGKSTNIFSWARHFVLYLKTIKIEAFLSNNVSEGEMLKKFCPDQQEWQKTTRMGSY